jgi:hypothetical protein
MGTAQAHFWILLGLPKWNSVSSRQEPDERGDAHEGQ